MTIIDRGENDPIPFILDDVDRAIARIARENIEAQRQARNAEDARQLEKLSP